jgi:hypothetical protein
MMTDIQGYYKCFSATDKNVSLYLTIFRPQCLWYVIVKKGLKNVP